MCVKIWFESFLYLGVNFRELDEVDRNFRERRIHAQRTRLPNYNKLYPVEFFRVFRGHAGRYVHGHLFKPAK